MMSEKEFEEASDAVIAAASKPVDNEAAFVAFARLCEWQLSSKQTQAWLVGRGKEGWTVCLQNLKGDWFEATHQHLADAADLLGAKLGGAS